MFKIFEPRTFATAIDAPFAPLRARRIIDIFSGISPAIGLIITASTTTETPLSNARPSRECTNGSAPMKIPIVPAMKRIIERPKCFFDIFVSCVR